MILGTLGIIYHRRVSIHGWIERCLLLHPPLSASVNRGDKLRCIRLTEDTFLPPPSSRHVIKLARQIHRKGIDEEIPWTWFRRDLSALQHCTHRSSYNTRRVVEKCIEAYRRMNTNERLNYSSYILSSVIFSLYLSSRQTWKGVFRARSSNKVGKKLNEITFQVVSLFITEWILRRNEESWGKSRG